MNQKPMGILSVDVEEWFHILEVDSTPRFDEWAKQPSRIEKNFHTLLELFDTRKTKATLFFLGWIAEKYPHLVREGANQGHEIASHGYAHQLIYTQNRSAFFEDVKKAKRILEDLTGNPVHGYRAPGFSVVKETGWVYEELAKAGYTYDSSVFPMHRGHGGIENGDRAPHSVKTTYGEILEFPITVADLLGKTMCFFGGGYLRLFPYPLIRKMSHQVNRQNRPVIYYIHPREIDPKHPRLPMSLPRRFKSYVGLHTTIHKLEKLLSEFNLGSFQEWLALHAPQIKKAA